MACISFIGKGPLVDYTAEVLTLKNEKLVLWSNVLYQLVVDQSSYVAIARHKNTAPESKI